MSKFKDTYRIESTRLPEYDYSRGGYYFVTICTHNRLNLFGNKINDGIHLNQFGNLVRNEWLNTEKTRKNIIVDTFVIMPNHLHGILIINEEYQICRDTLQRVSTDQNNNFGNYQIEKFGKPTRNSIPTIIRLFKSTITKQINIIRNTPGKPVWQSNYYEHVICNDKSLYEIRKYVQNNPLEWEDDEYFAL